MVLGISTVITLILMFLYLKYKEEIFMVFIIITVFAGFGIFGSVLTEKTEIQTKFIKYSCSKELGECRVKASGIEEVFTVTDFKHFEYLNSDTISTLDIEREYNSYGVLLNSNLIFNYTKNN